MYRIFKRKINLTGTYRRFHRNTIHPLKVGEIALTVSDGFDCQWVHLGFDWYKLKSKVEITRNC